MGLPDLYDVGSETYGEGEGIGNYGLMANAWGFDRTQYYPPHFSAWSKYKLGWITPTMVDESGLYSLRQACDYEDAIVISEGYPDGEYLIIENRQPCGFDLKSAQGGLAIYHIDENANNIRGYPQQNNWPYNGNHYIVAMLQADGNYDLERKINRGDGNDVFHAGYVNGIGPNGISGSRTKAFPNTKAYRNGNIINTKVSIMNIGDSDSTMAFEISFETSPATAPVSEPSPVATPTAPVALPSEVTCDDSLLRLKLYYDGGKISRDCSWVARKDTKSRCKIEGISAACPSTCGTCSTVEDTTLRFRLQFNGQKSRNCDWVGRKDSRVRCAVTGVFEACRSTCSNY